MERTKQARDTSHTVRVASADRSRLPAHRSQMSMQLNQLSFLQRMIGNRATSLFVSSGGGVRQRRTAASHPPQKVVQRALISPYEGDDLNALKRYAQNRVYRVHQDLIGKCKGAGMKSKHITAAIRLCKETRDKANENLYDDAREVLADWIAELNSLFELYAGQKGSEEERQSKNSHLTDGELTNDVLLELAGSDWNDEWANTPIPIDYARVPEMVKTLIKFIHQEDSVVGAEYATMSKANIARTRPGGNIEREPRLEAGEERRSNGSIVPDPRILRQLGTPVGDQENGQELAPVLREYEKEHYGLMRSWHIDGGGNLPDIRMNNENPAFENEKTRACTSKNVEDFLMKGGAPSVVLDGVQDNGAQGGHQSRATSDKRSLITTTLSEWENGIPGVNLEEENAERRKAASIKSYGKKGVFGNKQNLTLRPQGYAEYNLIGSWRLVYDYVNFKYYVTDHYQKWKPRKYPDKTCNPFFEVVHTGKMPLSVDGEMELYRLRYWENRRREGLETLE